MGWGDPGAGVSVGERRGGRSGEGSRISPPPYLGVHFPNLPLFPAGRGSSFCPTTTPAAATLTAAAASSGQDGRRAPWRLADRTAAWVGLTWVRSGHGLGAYSPGLKGWGGGGGSRGLYFFISTLACAGASRPSPASPFHPSSPSILSPVQRERTEQTDSPPSHHIHSPALGKVTLN